MLHNAGIVTILPGWVGWLAVFVLAGLLLGPLRADEHSPQPPEAQHSTTPPAVDRQQELIQELNRHLIDANKLRKEGKLAEAMVAAEKGLAMERTLLAAPNDRIAELLQFLATIHEEREDFSAARKARQEVLAIKTAVFGDHHWQVTDARLALQRMDRQARLDPADQRRLAEAEKLNEQACDLQQQGKYAEGIRSARHAVDIRKQVFGDRDRDYAAGVNNLAMLYASSGDYTRAEPLYREALKVWEQTLGKDHPDYAAGLNDLAILYKDVGNYARAEQFYRQALEVWKQARGEKHPDYASALQNLAELYVSMGAYVRAEPLCRQALEIRKQALGERHPDYAMSLMNLAHLYACVGDDLREETLLRQALKVWKETLGERHPDYAFGLMDLAALYENRGDFDRAEPLVRQALEVTRQALGEAHPDYGRRLARLGSLEQCRGDQAGAEAHFQRALKVIGEALGEQHPEYASILTVLGGLYYVQGDYARAEAQFRRALQIARRSSGARGPDYASGLIILADLYNCTGDYTRAEPLFREALALQERQLDETFDVLVERQRLAFLAELRANLDGYLSVAPQAGVPAGELYRLVLVWKGAVTARQTRERLAWDRPELTPVLAELNATRGRLSRLAFTAPGPDQRAAWLREVDELREHKEELERRLAEKGAALPQAAGQSRSGPAEVARALPPGAVLVDFLEYTHNCQPDPGSTRLRGEPRLLAFILRPGREPVLVPLGPTQPLRASIAYWRQALEEGRQPALKAASRELFQKLWQPLQPHVAGADIVLVSPDGPLCQFPLAALPGRRPGSYLIEDVAIGQVTSGRQVVEIFGEAIHRDSGGLLAIGGIDYDAYPGPETPEAASAMESAALAEQARAGFAPLPGTKAEAQAVGQAFRRSFPTQRQPLLLAGTEPTVARLRKELSAAPGKEPWRYLHLASHGFFAPPTEVSALRAPAKQPGTPALASGAEQERRVTGRDPMLLSGVVLAGAGRPGATGAAGILTAEEVMGFDLRGMELAVLSACETGLGEVAGGEGALGLQRAFQAAGARTLVTSLWKVDDAATSLLMEEFYVNLWQKKLPRLEALRQAQLTVLRHPELVEQRRRQMASGDKAGSETQPPIPQRMSNGRSPPSWWAAFILSGDIR